MYIISFIFKFISYSSIYPFSKKLAEILFIIFKKRTKIALYNINRIFPDMPQEKREEIVKNSYANIIANFLELIKIQNFSVEEINKVVKLHNIDVIEKALSKGNGCIVVFGHFGNWELSVTFPIFLKANMLGIGKIQKPKFLNNFIFKLRTHFGVKILNKKNSTISIYKALKRNSIVGLLVDQRSRAKNSTKINFFGEEIFASKAPAYFALRNNSPIVLLYSERGEDGVHNFYFVEELEIIRDSDNIEELITSNTQLINDKLTEIILKNPNNWFWLHSKFKKRKQLLKELSSN